MADFDVEGTFGDDYLHFYGPHLAEERNRAEAAEIVQTLQLEPAMRVLDVPCGHGRIATELAAVGIAVTGIELMEPFLHVARERAADRGVQVDYQRGDLRELPVSGPFDAVIAGSLRSATSRTTTTGGSCASFTESCAPAVAC